MAGESVAPSEREQLVELAWETDQLITGLSRLADSCRQAGLSGAADHWAEESERLTLTLLGLHARIEPA
jgi:hypothetical protein